MRLALVSECVRERVTYSDAKHLKSFSIKEKQEELLVKGWEGRDCLSVLCSLEVCSDGLSLAGGWLARLLGRVVGLPEHPKNIQELRLRKIFMYCTIKDF